MGVGVETISVGAGIGVSAGLANISASGIEFGPSIGFGPVINEGPVSPSFSLEPNMPFQISIFNPIAEAARAEPLLRSAEPVASVIQQAEQVAEEAWVEPPTSIATLVAIYGQPEAFDLFSPQTEPKVAPAPWIEYIPTPATQTVVKSAIGISPAWLTQTENKTEAGPITQPSQTITISVPQEQAVQAAEETVAEDEQEEVVEIKAQEEEKVQQVKAVHVIDRKAAARRITKILARALLVIAGLTAPQKIKGADLIIGLPTSSKQEIRGGEINIKDPEERLADKTWDATKEELQELEFDSLQQIETQVPEVVLNNHPVAVATKGEVASAKNVVKSHDNKAPHPHLVCEIRRKLKKEQSRISKSSQQPVHILVEEKQVTEEEKPIQAHPELAKALKAGNTG